MYRDFTRTQRSFLQFLWFKLSTCRRRLIRPRNRTHDLSHDHITRSYTVLGKNPRVILFVNVSNHMSLCYGVWTTNIRWAAYLCQVQSFVKLVAKSAQRRRMAADNQILIANPYHTPCMVFRGPTAFFVFDYSW